MLGFLIAIISGALMSVQGVFNTGLSKSGGMWLSAAFVQLSAFVVCIGAWLATGRDGTIGGLFSVKDKYMLLGGVMGAFITFTVIQSIQKLGAARGIMIIVVAQLIIAYLIEVFGWFGVEKTEISWRSIIGAVLAVLGVIVFKW